MVIRACWAAFFSRRSWDENEFASLVSICDRMPSIYIPPGETMRGIPALIFCALLASSGGAAHAFGPLGPPASFDREDESSVGIGYFRNASRMKPDAAGFEKVTAAQNQLFLELRSAVSFTEYGAGFIRIGAADFDDGNGFTDTFKPNASIGMKDVWYVEEGDRFKVGTIFLASIQGRFADSKGSESVAVESMWDVDLGIGIQKRHRDDMIVYGGPILYYGSAKVERNTGGAPTTSNFKMKDIFGAFAGFRYAMKKGVTIDVEAQYKGDFSAGAFVTLLSGIDLTPWSF